MWKIGSYIKQRKSAIIRAFCYRKGVLILNLNQYTKEEIKEMSLIELTHAILTESKQAIAFDELINQITKLQGVTKAEIMERIPQFYTDLNVDGRFNTSGENKWGLKDWYPIDQIEDEMTNPVKPKKKKTKKAVELDDDLEEDELDDFDDLDDVEDLSDDDDLLEDDDDDDIVEDDIVEDDFDIEEDDDEDLDDEDEDKI